MKSALSDLPIEERLRLVKDLWDSIAANQNALPLTDAQRAELDRRLDAYEADGNEPIRPSPTSANVCDATAAVRREAERDLEDAAH